MREPLAEAIQSGKNRGTRRGCHLQYRPLICAFKASLWDRIVFCGALFLFRAGAISDTAAAAAADCQAAAAARAGGGGRFPGDAARAGAGGLEDLREDELIAEVGVDIDPNEWYAGT